MNHFYWMILILLSVGSLAKAQWLEYQILPADTDPLIDGSNSFHWIYLDTAVTPQNKLLVFFPGTNAKGKDYRLFLQTGARLGYYVIGLDYQNDRSINLEVCPGVTDITCHGRARAEIWFGSDSHAALDVNFPNSIVNRLSRLLAYLERHYPEQGWGRFLLEGGQVEWSQVVTAGHSQGGGHAAFAAKNFRVDRAVMMAWTDWLRPGRTAEWIQQAGATPASAYYGFIHIGDAAIFQNIPATWADLGVLDQGPILSVDTLAPPYQNTHALVTALPIDTFPVERFFHNAPCADQFTPRDETGQPTLRPVWEYLLGHSALPTSTEQLSAPEVSSWTIFPNPTQGPVRIMPRHDRPANYTVTVLNNSGQVISGPLDRAVDLDLSQVPVGVYWVVIETLQGRWGQPLVRSE